MEMLFILYFYQDGVKRTGGFIGNAFLLSCQAIIEVPEDQYNSLHIMCVCVCACVCLCV